MDEHEKPGAYKSVKIAEELPFGDGAIDGNKIIGDAERDDPGVRNRVEAFIRSPEVLVDVETLDDGCSDGRFFAGNVLRHGRELMRAAVNKTRPKVFGGGSAMAMADIVGSGEADGTPLREVFRRGIGVLQKQRIEYGAHTDSHASEAHLGGRDENSGCGAIDKADPSIRAIGTYGSQMRTVLSLIRSHIVKSDSQNATGLSDLLVEDHTGAIIKDFGDYVAAGGTADYRGGEVIDDIVDDGKIVKELGGGHLEGYIIINCVRGKTVDQGAIREISKGKIDVFVIDAWRLQDLAAGLHPAGADSGETEESAAPKRQRAFQSMLLYTLGVSAVLTNGKLGTFVIMPAGA